MRNKRYISGKRVHRAYHWGILIILASCLSYPSFAQEVQFSQYEAFPLYMNPAMTGRTEQQRIALNSRSQWVDVNGAFNTIGFAYDYNFKKYRSGLGMILVQDESSGGAFSTFTAGGLFSHRLRLGDHLFLNTGLKASYIQQRLDPGRLVFTDQLIRNDGSSTYEVFDQLNNDMMDYSWGNILFIADSSEPKMYWLGMVFDHLSKPKNTFKNSDDAYIPVKFTMHGGAQYRLGESTQGFPENIVTVNFMYKSQLKWDQLDLGASYIKRVPHKKRTLKEWGKSQAKFEPSYKQNFGRATASSTPMPLVYVEGGLTYRGLPLLKHYAPGYRNHEAFVVLFGFNYYQVKVAYTFDFTISMLRYSNSGGAHEVSMVYNFLTTVSDKKKRKKKAKKNRALFDGV